MNSRRFTPAIFAILVGIALAAAPAVVRAVTIDVRPQTLDLKVGAAGELYASAEGGGWPGLYSGTCFHYPASKPHDVLDVLSTNHRNNGSWGSIWLKVRAQNAGSCFVTFSAGSAHQRVTATIHVTVEK